MGPYPLTVLDRDEPVVIYLGGDTSRMEMKTGLENMKA